MNKTFKIISIVSFLYATLYILFHVYIANEDSLFAKFEEVYWSLVHGETNRYTLKYSLILGVVSLIGYIFTRNSND